MYFSSKIIIQTVAKMLEKDTRDLALDKVAFLIFPRSTLDRLFKLTNASKVDWIPKGFHPYASGEIYCGTYEGIGVTIV